MISTNVSRWYDVECDNPVCERLSSVSYGHCVGWALPVQAIKSALEAGWGMQDDGTGIERMYCPLCRQKLAVMTPTPEFLAALRAGWELRFENGRCTLHAREITA